MTLAEALEAAGSAHWASEAQRARHKVALLVEGDDDRLLVEAVLGSLDPLWANRVAVIACGGRVKVLRALAKGNLPHGQPVSGVMFGLVDRDTWTSAEVAREQAAAGGALLVTPGWCAESDLFDPVVWGPLLPDDDARRSVREQLDGVRERWVAAGAWWTVVQRAREGLQAQLSSSGASYGHPLAGVDLSDAAAVRAHAGGLATLSAALSPAQLASEQQRLLQAWSAFAAGEQWSACVHSKSAFGLVLVRSLNAVSAQRSAKVWRGLLAPGLKRRALYQELFAKLGL